MGAKIIAMDRFIIFVQTFVDVLLDEHSFLSRYYRSHRLKLSRGCYEALQFALGMKLSALTFSAQISAAQIYVGLGTVSYTHLTLPTNREV